MLKRERKQKILALFLILVTVNACSNESEIRDDNNYGSAPKKAPEIKRKEETEPRV